MRRALALILALSMTILMCACGSSAVKDAETAINEIGEVTTDSLEQITKAEKLYNLLTDAEKGKVKNRLALVEAREEFDKLQKAIIYDNAKKAYEELNAVADLCVKGMDDIYGAWYYGIYKLKDHNYDMYYWFASETPHLSQSDLEKAASDLGFSETLVRSDWQYCLYVAETALANKGVYDDVNDKMADSLSILQELTETYNDYEYYPKLKEYYAKVSSYVEFFNSPSGSFKQLADTINDYENNIRTYQTDVGFLFSK